MAATGLPEQDVALVRHWCDQRVPERVRDQVRVECEVAPRHLTIVDYSGRSVIVVGPKLKLHQCERRAPWSQEMGPEWTSFPIARLRYTKVTGTWELYWRDRNLRFHRYEQARPSRQGQGAARRYRQGPDRHLLGVKPVLILSAERTGTTAPPVRA